MDLREKIALRLMAAYVLQSTLLITLVRVLPLPLRDALSGVLFVLLVCIAPLILARRSDAAISSYHRRLLAQEAQRIKPKTPLWNNDPHRHYALDANGDIVSYRTDHLSDEPPNDSGDGVQRSMVSSKHTFSR